VPGEKYRAVLERASKAGFEWVLDDDMKNMSVTGLEMAHAYLRNPRSGEAFFYIRNGRFMRQPGFLSLPLTARRAFETDNRTAMDRLINKVKSAAKDRLTTYEVRVRAINSKDSSVNG